MGRNSICVIYDSDENYAKRLMSVINDDNDIPYANTKYIARLPDGTTKDGITSDDGRSEIFFSDKDGEILIHLFVEQDK